MVREDFRSSQVSALISMFLLADALRNFIVSMITVLSPVVFLEVLCAEFVLSWEDELKKAAIKIPVSDEASGALSEAVKGLSAQNLSKEERGFLRGVEQTVKDECDYIRGIWKRTAENLWQDMNIDNLGGLTKRSFLLNVFESEVAKACLKEQDSVMAQAAIFAYRTLMTLSLTVVFVARHYTVRLADQLGSVFAKLCIAASLVSTPKKQKNIEKAMSALKILGGPLYLVYRAYQLSYKFMKTLQKVGGGFSKGVWYGAINVALRKSGSGVPKFEKEFFNNALVAARKSTTYEGQNPREFMLNSATDDETFVKVGQVFGQNSPNRFSRGASEAVRVYEEFSKATKLIAGALGFYVGSIVLTICSLAAKNTVGVAWASTRVGRS